VGFFCLWGGLCFLGWFWVLGGFFFLFSPIEYCFTTLCQHVSFPLLNTPIPLLFFANCIAIGSSCSRFPPCMSLILGCLAAFIPLSRCIFFELAECGFVSTFHVEYILLPGGGIHPITSFRLSSIRFFSLDIRLGLS